MNCKFLKDKIYCDYPDKAIRESEAPDGICADEAYNLGTCGMWEEGPAEGWAESDRRREQVVTKLGELEQ